MSYVRVWRYRIPTGQEATFVQAYGPEGDWARLFRRSDGYLGTELLRPVSPVIGYVTIDRWRTEADWRRFLENHGEVYRELDRRLASLTTENVEIGSYEG